MPPTRPASPWTLLALGLLCSQAAAQGTIPDRTGQGAIPNRTTYSPIPLRAGAGEIGDPSTAANSMYQNMRGRFLGMGQQVVNRTPDNAAGVYWRMYYANQARERSVYMGMMDIWVDGKPMLNPVVRERLRQEQELQNEQARQRLADETIEIKWRQDIRNRLDQPTGTAVSFPGADMLRKPAGPLPLAQSAPTALAASAPSEVVPPTLSAPAAPAAPITALPSSPTAMSPIELTYPRLGQMTDNYPDKTPIHFTPYGPLGGRMVYRFPNFHNHSPSFPERSPNFPDRSPSFPDRAPNPTDLDPTSSDQ